MSRRESQGEYGQPIPDTAMQAVNDEDETKRIYNAE